jgi:hypothetical protein
MNFFYFCGSFLPSWIRIRIQITDPDPDPMARLNTDPIRIRIRIRNPANNITKPLNNDLQGCKSSSLFHSTHLDDSIPPDDLSKPRLPTRETVPPHKILKVRLRPVQ